MFLGASGMHGRACACHRDKGGLPDSGCDHSEYKAPETRRSIASVLLSVLHLLQMLL